MRKSAFLTAVVVVAIFGATSVFGGIKPTQVAKPQPTTRTTETAPVPQPTESAPVPVEVTPIQPQPAVISPQAGEAIDWQVLAGGGADMAGGTYAVSGTIGQPVVGSISGSSTTVDQGYWQVFACCTGKRGNVDLKGIVDLTDLSILIDYLTIVPHRILPCPDAANVNALGIIDLSDLSWLIDYLTVTPPRVLPNCP